MQKPAVAILKTDGINCDMEMAHAFEVAGASPELIHVNQLRSRERNLGEYAILAIPGGFSYGDDIASGAVLGNELTTQLADQVNEFITQEKPVIGICNGFQVLNRAGILPDPRTSFSKPASLTKNESGRFICKWVDLEVPKNAKCEFVKGLDTATESIPMQIAHAEGKFFAPDEEIQRLRDMGEIAFTYKVNPNGSASNIAGITDNTGLVLGMMPHPERSIVGFHPDRSKTNAARTAAQIIFQNIVNYAKES